MATVGADLHRRIMDLTRKGKSGSAIARELRVHHRTVRKVRSEHGIPPDRNQYDPEVHRQIIDLTHQGVSGREIAKRLKVCERTVSRVRRDNGLAKPIPPLTEDELRRAKQLLDDGASYKEVGRTLHRCDTAIARAWPGYTMTTAQVAELAALGRKMARLEWRHHE